MVTQTAKGNNKSDGGEKGEGLVKGVLTGTEVGGIVKENLQQHQHEQQQQQQALAWAWQQGLPRLELLPPTNSQLLTPALANAFGIQLMNGYRYPLLPPPPVSQARNAGTNGVQDSAGRGQERSSLYGGGGGGGPNQQQQQGGGGPVVDHGGQPQMQNTYPSFHHGMQPPSANAASAQAAAAAAAAAAVAMAGGHPGAYGYPGMQQFSPYGAPQLSQRRGYHELYGRPSQDGNHPQQGECRTVARSLPLSISLSLSLFPERSSRECAVAY